MKTGSQKQLPQERISGEEDINIKHIISPSNSNTNIMRITSQSSTSLK